MTVVLAPIGPRRGPVTARTWWGRAWLRAAEESAYGDADLAEARRLARGGDVGGLVLDAGSITAAVGVGARDPVSAVVRLPTLHLDEQDALVEVLAGAGALAALGAGDLPHPVVEHAEELGVELLPDGAAFAVACTCRAWRDPCPHALALLLQTAWLLDADPFVLLALRGLAHADVVARVRAVVTPSGTGERSPETVDPLDVGLEAAMRAAALLAALEEPGRSSVARGEP